MIFDFHVHCFPDALAPRAVAALTENARIISLKPLTDGTAAGTEKCLRSAGITGAHVLNIATNVRQTENVNRFAATLSTVSNGFFIPAGTVHPDCEDKERVIKALHDAGIRGIKVHPDYVRVNIDDPRYDEIFSLCEEAGMYVVTHAGFDPVSPDYFHAKPEGMLKVIRSHPRLTFVAAHMGGPSQLDGVLELLAGTNVYFDTSLISIREDERDKLKTLFHAHDPDRIFFGTDTPWSDPKAEIAIVESMDLTETAKEKIFYKNAARLLNL
ncbi:MAG: amidohydrolase family protein [Clostridia bacterium]|nr:amidohydrolase family protein [Clostridia bacterium]